VICVSQAEAALVMRRFPLAHESIEVIPNGIDTDWLRRAEPLDELRTLLLSVGRVERYKRVHLAIDSMRYLDDRFLLAVAGTGGALPNLRRQVAEAGLQDRVLLLGSVPTSQLARLYRSAAVSLTLSEHESFSITPREALAAGARVVLSDIPVHREIQAAVGSEYAALLSTPARPADVAEAVRRLAALGPSDAEYQPSGWDDVAAATLAVYERVLSGK
jgi:glycosyltransferase involved in cell wall biosynthesis